MKYKIVYDGIGWWKLYTKDLFWWEYRTYFIAPNKEIAEEKALEFIELWDKPIYGEIK